MQNELTYRHSFLKSRFNGVLFCARPFWYSFFWYFAPKGQ